MVDFSSSSGLKLIFLIRFIKSLVSQYGGPLHIPKPKNWIIYKYFTKYISLNRNVTQAYIPTKTKIKLPLIMSNKVLWEKDQNLRKEKEEKRCKTTKKHFIHFFYIFPVLIIFEFSHQKSIFESEVKLVQKNQILEKNNRWFYTLQNYFVHQACNSQA